MSKCVILAAGKGSRMSSVTNGTSKEMLLINGIPMIDYAIIEARNSGCDDILVVIDSRKTDLDLHLNRVGIMTVSLESDGIIQSLKSAFGFVGRDSFALILPDMISEKPILKQLIVAARWYKKSFLGLCNEDDGFGSGYYVDVISVGNDVFQVAGFNHVHNGIRVFGRYVFESGIYEYINGLPDKDSEVDLLNYLASNNKLYGLHISENVYDAGTPIGYEQIIKALA